MSLDKDVQLFIIGGIVLILLAYMSINTGQNPQILIIGGVILIVLASIWAMRGKKFNMRSHHKIQIVALLGLTSIALIAVVLAKLNNVNDSSTFIAVASAAVGGIAGFMSHKVTTPNKTVLLPILNQEAVVGSPLKFIVTGFSTANYNLNYKMSSQPTLPSSATLNETSGEFNYTPVKGEENEYHITFTVSDGLSGSDSRTIIINVKTI